MLPSTEPDKICCSLETYSTNDNPFYIAVSYEWGNMEAEIDIRIDGRPFRIRHNLWLFLHYLQTKNLDMVTSDSFRLWQMPYVLVKVISRRKKMLKCKL